MNHSDKMKNGFKAGIWKRGVSLFLVLALLQFLIAQEALAFVGAPAIPLPLIENFQELSSFVPQKILQKDKRDKDPLATTLFLAFLHLGLRMDLVAFSQAPSFPPRSLAQRSSPLGPLRIQFAEQFALGQLTPWTYDANGNTGRQSAGTASPRTCRSCASGMTARGNDTLSYDSENRLKEITAYEGTTNTQSYTLKPGWNVVSFTWLPDNKLVSNILSSLVFGTDYDQVSTWDSASSSWKHWVNDPDFNDFTEFQRGKTYEIYNKSGVDKTFSVTGKSSGPDISHSIASGDNFISPAVKTATNVTTVLSSLTYGTHYSDVKRFNATTQTWESYASSQFTQFEPGKGYNIIGLTSASFSYGNTQQTTTFVYDSTGSRVKKTSGSTTTVYLGKDYEVEGSTSTKYLFLGDRRISLKDSSGLLLFLHGDHINSSNIITDSSGNQSGLIEYDPYGTTVTQTGSANPKHKFTGQESDDSSHLYYYGARYMDPQIGRFITADPTVQHPFDPQDLNRYAYARNNPIKFMDPTGLGFFKKLFGWIGAAIGAIVGFATGGPAGAVEGARRGYDIGKRLGQALDNIIAISKSDGSTAEAAIKIAIAFSDANSPGGWGEDTDGDGVNDGKTNWTDLAGLALRTSLKIIRKVNKTTAASSSHPDLKAQGEAANKIHLSTYTRPALFNAQHTFHIDSTRNRLWEMVPGGTIPGTSIGVYPGMPFGHITTREREGSSAIEAYLRELNGKYKKAYETTANAEEYDKAKALYEKRHKGLPYNPGFQNSNYARRTVETQGGGEGRKLREAPESVGDLLFS